MNSFSTGDNSVQCVDMPSDHSAANDEQSHSDDDKTDEFAGASRLLAAGVEKLPDGEWLSTESVMQLLLDPPEHLKHLHVPTGQKDDCFCLANNSENLARHSKGKRRAFDDNCGTWIQRMLDCALIHMCGQSTTRGRVCFCIMNSTAWRDR